MLQRPPSLSPDLVKLRRRVPPVTGADWNACVLSFSRSLTLSFSRSLRVRPCRSLELRSCRAHTSPLSNKERGCVRRTHSGEKSHANTLCSTCLEDICSQPEPYVYFHIYPLFSVNSVSSMNVIFFFMHLRSREKAFDHRKSSLAPLMTLPCNIYQSIIDQLYITSSASLLNIEFVFIAGACVTLFVAPLLASAQLL